MATSYEKRVFALSDLIRQCFRIGSLSKSTIQGITTEDYEKGLTYAEQICNYLNIDKQEVKDLF